MRASEAREGWLVDAALHCYPARWRRRHADEAAELAALLIRDGNPAASIAWSYLVGAAREWLTPPPGRSLSTVAAALLAAACLLGSARLLGGTIDVLPGLEVRGFLPCRSRGTSEGSCFTDNRPRKRGSYAVSAGV